MSNKIDVITDRLVAAKGLLNFDATVPTQHQPALLAGRRSTYRSGRSARTSRATSEASATTNRHW